MTLDRGQAEAHLALAILALYFDHDYPAARKEFEQAVEADPASPRNHHWFAGYFSALGDDERAVAQMEEAQALDPHSSLVVSDIGWYLYLGRRFEDAVVHLERAIQLEPESSHFARETLVLVLTKLGKHERARAEALAFMSRAGIDSGRIRSLGSTPPGEGIRDYMRWRLSLQAGQPSAASARAFLALAALNQREDALKSLEGAQRDRWPWLVGFLRDPVLDPLRGEPRFEALRRDLRLSP